MKRLAPAIALGAAVASCDALTSPATVTHMQRGDWGFEMIDSMTTPPDDPSLGCGVTLPADENAQARASCAFGVGSRASQSLAVEPTALAAIPVRHVIVMMKENRSFDHLLGKLEPVPASYTNPDANGQAVAPTHATTTCIPFDPSHQSAAVAECLDDGKMDGFVRNAASTTSSDGHFAMDFYDSSDLPFYYWLASTFALGDRQFAPMAGGTFANRNYLLFGSNAGVVDTGIVYPPPTTPSLFQLLINAGFTWRAYSDGSPLSGTLDWSHDDPGVRSIAQLLDDLDHGALPNVAFVDGIDNKNDDHPPADLQAGEALTKVIYDHVVASPQWMRVAMIWTYDEAGGFADHVPPPTACRAEWDSPFVQLGPRVPLVVVSPWAKRGYVSHVVRDHTAITRFIEAVFDLPALTARDANADALLDMFDFACGRDLSVEAAPAAGTGLCANPTPSPAN